MKIILSLHALLLFSSLALANKVCHLKPPGECEKCCRLSNEASFGASVKSACARLGSADKSNVKEVIQAEINTYSLTEKKLNIKDSVLFREYLMATCYPGNEYQNSYPVKMAYSDCAKGCPPPSKAKGSNKGKDK